MLKKGLVGNDNKKKMIVMCESSLENVKHPFVKLCACAHVHVCMRESVGVCMPECLQVSRVSGNQIIFCEKCFPH